MRVLLIEDSTITKARLALGGVGTIPWRAREAGALSPRLVPPIWITCTSIPRRLLMIASLAEQYAAAKARICA